MANTSLFASLKKLLPRATARNEAGGPAYEFTPKHALAQLATTGCFNGTFYAHAESQLGTLKSLIEQVLQHYDKRFALVIIETEGFSIEIVYESSDPPCLNLIEFNQNLFM